MESPAKRVSNSSSVFNFPNFPTWSLVIRKSEFVLHWINRRENSATAKSGNLDIFGIDGFKVIFWIVFYVRENLSHYLFQDTHDPPYKSGTGKDLYYRVLPGARSTPASCCGTFRGIPFFFCLYFLSFDLIVQYFIGSFPINCLVVFSH